MRYRGLFIAIVVLWAERGMMTRADERTHHTFRYLTTSGYPREFKTITFSPDSAQLAVSVAGKETIDVAAGSFEAYKVAWEPLDGEPGGGTIWVSTDPPRKIVRMDLTIPPMQGGGTVKADLQSVE